MLSIRAYTRRLLFVGGCLGILVSLIFMFFGSLRQKDPNTLRIGMLSGWAPFMTINHEGNFDGFDVDIAKEIGARLGKKVEIIDAGSLAALFLLLEQNSIDFAMSGLDITAQREARYRMVPYIGADLRHFYLIFAAAIPTGINSLETVQKAGLSVAAEPGSPQFQFIETVPNIEVVPHKCLTDMLMAVKYKKVDAMIVEEGIMKRAIKQDQTLKSLAIPLPEKFVVKGMGIAFNKTNNELAEKVMAIVTELKQNGFITQRAQAWHLE